MTETKKRTSLNLVSAGDGKFEVEVGSSRTIEDLVSLHLEPHQDGTLVEIKFVADKVVLAYREKQITAPRE